jgi:hypothetical protein
MKLLIKHEKNTKRSNQTSAHGARKGAKPARVIPFRPIYAAAAHIDRSSNTWNISSSSKVRTRSRC